MLQTMEFSSSDWTSVADRPLQDVAWALCLTISTTTGYSPGQLAFSRDMIMQHKIIADWTAIQDNKKKATIMTNTWENKSCIQHVYHEGNKILLLIDSKDHKSKLDSPTEGPYEVLRAYDNGTIHINQGSYEETINIRRVKPFHNENH